jgi:hypothetical protein
MKKLGIKCKNLWFMVLKYIPVELKKIPTKIFVGGGQCLAWVGRQRSVPLETQNNCYISLDNWQSY